MSCSHVSRIRPDVLLACVTGVYFAYSYKATARDNRFTQKSIVPVSLLYVNRYNMLYYVSNRNNLRLFLRNYTVYSHLSTLKTGING